ncbi:DEBR0S5_04412g1_1 [Brettanomyces bruxellensis]|uniref:Palmitoyltransferase n=1 Tax=Dekkera bruxellensis TaxID=5007 RepID=A0A7D9H1D9_DEKBR|nr:DEBR0S5_04412g1_1 [Brettanomyces bruxellensis]
MKPIKLICCLQRFTPLCVVALLGFLEYSFSYEFSYKCVHPRSASIGLIVIFNVLLTLIFGLWFAVLYSGPGFIECQIPPYDLDSFFKNGQKYIKDQQKGDCSAKNYEIVTHKELLSVPDMFICNFQGLPGWCTTCKSLKLTRAHHSSSCNRCVITMDHFCTFLGGVIGQKNYGMFLGLIVLMNFICLFSFISIFSLRKSVNGTHPTTIICVIGCITFFGMVTNLILQNLLQIRHNETTIEQLAKGDIKRAYRRIKKKGIYEKDHLKRIATYVNLKHPSIEGIRLVVPLTVEDYPYDTGSFIENFRCRTSRRHASLFQDKKVIAVASHQEVSKLFAEKLLERIHKHEIEVTIFGKESIET